MSKLHRLTVFLILSACLASCKEKEDMPKTVAVVPIYNQSQDITMPVLMRYFIEERLKSKGFKLPIRIGEVDSRLLQMGLVEGAKINDGDIRNIGQFLKVEGILNGTLMEASLYKGVRTLRASFSLISVHSGRILWEKQYKIEQAGQEGPLVQGTVTTNWTLKSVRALVKTGAGKFPKQVIRKALKDL